MKVRKVYSLYLILSILLAFTLATAAGEQEGDRKSTPPKQQQQPAKKPGGLLPRVVVTDAAAVPTLDWAALREREGTAYPSRWDDLTLVDTCLWVPAGELAERLGLSVRLTARHEDHQCKYRVHLGEGNSPVVLSVYAELHDGTEFLRQAEESHSKGVSGMQFTRFDAGTPDLNVYVHKKGKYLYAFPRDGRTLWRLGYMASPQRDAFYRPGEPGIAQDIGPRFLQLLVEKYGERL